MMMFIVRDDGLYITDLYEKPGFIFIIKGLFIKSKEIFYKEIEIYKENYIQVKFRLKKTDEMLLK